MRNKPGDDVTAPLSTTRRGPIEQHRYSAGVISFVIGERTRGVTWKQIGESVKSRFGVKPTERQMRTWWKKYGVSMETGVRQLAEKYLMEMAPAMISRSMEVTLRVFSPLQKRFQELGVPPDRAAWFATLLTLECVVGRENFAQLLKDYEKIGDKLREEVDADAIVDIFFPLPPEKAKERKKPE